MELLKLKQGSLIKLDPGPYVRVKISEKDENQKPVLHLQTEKKGILVEFQGKDSRTGEDCWSALVDDNLLLVWNTTVAEI